jgi:type IV pilus assembly protein PilX
MYKFKYQIAMSPSLQRNLLLNNQRGVVMIIALIVLIAMSLAGVALVRSVDTANLVAGNIAFKQGALQEGNSGMEAAINKFSLSGPLVPTTNTELLFTHIADQNYSANILPSNAAGVPLVLVNKDDFDASASFAIKKVTDPRTRSDIRFVIERLCLNTGEFEIESCRFDESSGRGKDARGDLGGDYIPLYRITTRVDGPNNTVSYTQAIIAASTSPGT